MAEVYEYSKNANNEKLDEEIRASSFGETLYDGSSINHGIDPDAISVYITTALDTAQQDELTAIIVAHDSSERSTANTAISHRLFGVELVHRYHRKFIDAGLFQHALVYEVAVILERVSGLSNVGNMYAAESELEQTVALATFLTAETITAMRNEIRVFLDLEPI